MDLVTAPAEIRSALAELRPTRIAVAYVGRNWAEYIPDLRAVTEIIVSPTLGSNPRAIRVLMDVEDLTVHFLDNLHSKIYIGQDRALIGSCNLSDNALAEGRLHEAALVTRDPDHLRTLNDTFEAYRALAMAAYPDARSKERRLKALEAAAERAREAGLLNKGKKGPAATLDRLPKNYPERIHLAWWHTEGEGPESAVVKKLLPDASDTEFANWVDLAPEDDVRPGDWLLTWRSNAKGLPWGRNNLDWMRVDAVLPNASGDADYPNTAVQVDELNPNEAPFKLTREVKLLAYQLLAEPRSARLRPTGFEDTVRPIPAEPEARKFINQLRKRFTAAASS